MVEYKSCHRLMTAFTLSLFLFGCPGFPAQVAAEHLSCDEPTDAHKIHRNHHMGPLMFSFRPTKSARRNKTGRVLSVLAMNQYFY